MWRLAVIDEEKFQDWKDFGGGGGGGGALATLS